MFAGVFSGADGRRGLKTFGWRFPLVWRFSRGGLDGFDPWKIVFEGPFGDLLGLSFGPRCEGCGGRRCCAEGVLDAVDDERRPPLRDSLGGACELERRDVVMKRSLTYPNGPPRPWIISARSHRGEGASRAGTTPCIGPHHR